MDLGFTDAQTAYRQTLRQWIAANLPDAWKQPGLYRGPDDEDEAAALELDWARRLFAAGYAGLAWPREYGGQGRTIVEQFILNEELGRVAAPEGVNIVGVELAGPIILAAGTDEQKRHHIPRILSADSIWCQGFSEPNAGSDLASLKTFAVRDGNDWVINGQKVWTTHARHANLCLLLARTEKDASNSHRNMSLAVLYAAHAIDIAAEDADMAVAVAKSYCAQAARQIAGHAIQLHGGIGYTWEFGLHLYLRRVMRCAASCGTTQATERRWRPLCSIGRAWCIPPPCRSSRTRRRKASR